MPINEYECQNCKNIFEALILKDKDIPTKCQKCGGKIKKIISTSTFSLKGDGWTNPSLTGEYKK